LRTLLGLQCSKGELSRGRARNCFTDDRDTLQRSLLGSPLEGIESSLSVPGASEPPGRHGRKWRIVKIWSESSIECYLSREGREGLRGRSAANLHRSQLTCGTETSPPEGRGSWSEWRVKKRFTPRVVTFLARSSACTTKLAGVPMFRPGLADSRAKKALALEGSERWFLVHTQPHGERKAALHLGAQSFKTYFPQIQKTVPPCPSAHDGSGAAVPALRFRDP